MSKENHDYKVDSSGVFSGGDSDSRYRVASGLFKRGYTAIWVAKSCGITEAKAREYYARWRAEKPRE